MSGVSEWSREDHAETLLLSITFLVIPSQKLQNRRVGGVWGLFSDFHTELPFLDICRVTKYRQKLFVPTVLVAGYHPVGKCKANGRSKASVDTLLTSTGPGWVLAVAATT